MSDRAPELARILDHLRRLVRVLRDASRAAERRLGVSGAQLFALKALAEQPSLSLNELARRTSTHQSTVSVVVKRLVAARLVSRLTAADDARRLELAATAKGRALLRKAPNAAQDQLIDGLLRLSAADRLRLAGTLHKLIAAMGVDEELPAMFFEDDHRPRKLKRRRG
jgi:DNA-binding MarR family transcriptional regulator